VAGWPAPRWRASCPAVPSPRLGPRVREVELDPDVVGEPQRAGERGGGLDTPPGLGDGSVAADPAASHAAGDGDQLDLAHDREVPGYLERFRVSGDLGRGESDHRVLRIDRCLLSMYT
jgi:hypothetical protein